MSTSADILLRKQHRLLRDAFFRLKDEQTTMLSSPLTSDRQLSVNEGKRQGVLLAMTYIEQEAKDLGISL